MSDEQQVALDNPDIPMVDWKSARNKGETHVAAPVAEEKEEETDKEAPKEEPKEDKPKVKGGFQVKIDRLTKINAEIEKRAEAAEKRAAELEAKNGKTEEKKADGEPNRDDFTTDEEFWKALGRWTARQEIKAQQEAAEKAEQEAADKELIDAHELSISEARAKYDDYDEKVKAVNTPWKQNNPAQLRASEAFTVALIESGIGGEILNYFGDHPEEITKWENYSPAKVQMAMGRIVDKIEAAGEESEEKETPKKKAAAEEDEEEEKPKKVPVKPISGTTKSDVALADMTSLRDFKKARNAGRVR